MKKYCTECGNSYSSLGQPKFCPECGVKLGGVATNTVPHASQNQDPTNVGKISYSIESYASRPKLFGEISQESKTGDSRPAGDRTAKQVLNQLRKTAEKITIDVDE